MDSLDVAIKHALALQAALDRLEEVREQGQTVPPAGLARLDATIGECLMTLGKIVGMPVTLNVGSPVRRSGLRVVSDPALFRE